MRYSMIKDSKAEELEAKGLYRRLKRQYSHQRQKLAVNVTD
ncbi:PerC family transcriptional regulator [Escherichia coli]|nr:PerC family transcriptional regulator [Escherichia coli]